MMEKVLLDRETEITDETTDTYSDTNPNASRDIFLGDAWFSGIDLLLLTSKVHRSWYIGVVKTNSSRFPKEFLQTVMKDWSGGSYLNLTATIDDVKIVATGYKYCNKKLLMFIWTYGAGHTEPGDPYVAKWMDNNMNRCERHIPRPSVISFYFAHCNGIDVHNGCRQKDLRLEKCWVTCDGFSRLLTSLFGMNVVDSWRAYRAHSTASHRHKDVQLLDFASMLAYDMLNNTKSKEHFEEDSFSIALPPAPDTPTTAPNNLQTSPESVSTPIQERNNSLVETNAFLCHQLVQTALKEKTSSGSRTKRMECKLNQNCKKKTSHYCVGCSLPGEKIRWMCRGCFHKHQRNVFEALSEA